LVNTTCLCGGVAGFAVVAPSDPGDRAGFPAEYLFEFGERRPPGPAASLFEGDQRAGVEDPLLGQGALGDVEFAAACRDRGAGTGDAGVGDVAFLGGFPGLVLVLFLVVVVVLVGAREEGRVLITQANRA
jgi:hypothetical protein